MPNEAPSLCPMCGTRVANEGPCTYCFRQTHVLTGEDYQRAVEESQRARVFMRANFSAEEMRIAAEVLADDDYQRIVQDGAAMQFTADLAIRLSPQPGEKQELNFVMLKNRDEGVPCRLCGWTYFEARCPCRLPREERLRLAEEATRLRGLTRFNREDVI